MAEQTFKSPGFFEQEIDLSTRSAAQLGTPAGVIGTSNFGPAFVPVTIGSFIDFENKFGGLSPDKFGPYAVKEFLKHRDAVTFTRVLGAGNVSTTADIANYELGGIVNNAGFNAVADPITADSSGRTMGSTIFISAIHTVPANSDIGYPVFTDNDSFTDIREAGVGTAASDTVALIRAGIMTTTGSVVYILDSASSVTAPASMITDLAAPVDKRFKLAVYSTLGQAFGDADGISGMRVFTVSLDPDDAFYIGKVLNTNPEKFSEEQHLLYLDYAVEDQLASVATAAGSIAILSGSDNSVTNAGATVADYNELYGRFDTRYQAPKTTPFISQPYGTNEFNLFHFESISDGAYSNDKFKVSIANLRASNDPNYDYGTFEVQIRRFDDSDLAPQILERYSNVSLDPNSSRFIAKIIGDYKLSFNFDDIVEEEKRLILAGKYPNQSSYVRITMSDEFESGEVPKSALPFGFRGIPALITSPGGAYDSATARLFGTDAAASADIKALTLGIIPPLPLTYKVTKGAAGTSPTFIGDPGIKERTDGRIYWGVKLGRLENSVDSVLNPNVSGGVNELVRTYTKLQGIQKLDAVTAPGTVSDSFNNNKFSLSRVALRHSLDVFGDVSEFTGSISTHMKEATYMRNGVVDASTYTVPDIIEGTDRITMATLVNSSSILFNKFSVYNKFTNIFHGGFDGLNILDRDCARMNDKAASTEPGGKAGDSFAGGLGLVGTNDGAMMGSGKNNNIVSSYRSAIEIMTDAMTVRTNILAIPGIKDSYVTDYAAALNKDYSMALFLMDIPGYNEDGGRLFNDSRVPPAISVTSDSFIARNIDNNYSATYFPEVFIEDETNGNRRVRVPASIAALGALAYTDSVSYPWFAPAGFNRGSLGFVKNVSVRLTSGDRDTLYEARINPIANFPGGDIVIFGQKTLQMSKSALDRVNVRRMLLELKRQVSTVTDKLLFEQNNQSTRDRFINLISPKLGLIQTQQGIEKFRVIMDDTNNTELDKENNTLNGKIIVVPTRTIEFVSVDFVITNAGVSFA